MKVRTSWQVTKSVWYALFMREMLSRMFGNRYAWFWLLAEPMMFVGVMVAIRSFIRVLSDVAGVEMIPWMVIGLTAFFMFRDGMTRAMGALNANKGLFAYRQVKPVDTVLIRVFVEAVVHSTVIFLFIITLMLLGFNMQPYNLVMALFAWFSLWCLGLSVGLILSVIVTIVPDLSKIVNVMTLPLMILSGAFLPVQFMPYSVQQILLYNPVLHCIEFLRLQYFSGYWTMSEIQISYFYQWLLPLLALGLLLHLRFELKLKQK
jgi:capsular polysaccharide transport system permease protein